MAATAPKQPGSPTAAPYPNPKSISSPQGTKRRRTLRLLLPWAFTTLFAGAVYALVKVYHTKGVLTPSQKNAYNVLSTGLFIILGASLLVRYSWRGLCINGFSLTLWQETLKKIAKSLPHYIDHWFKPSPKSQTLIEGLDSLLNVLRLVPFASTQMLRLVCILWVSHLFRPAIETFSPPRSFNYFSNLVRYRPRVDLEPHSPFLLLLQITSNREEDANVVIQ